MEVHLEWTWDEPVEHGYYWWRFATSPRVVSVYGPPGDFWVDFGHGETRRLKSLPGRWAGPLIPPEYITDEPLQS